VAPVLFEWGFLRIHSFGVMLALSFVLGILLAERRARRREVGEAVMSTLYVVILLAGVLGCRLAYVAFHPEELDSAVDLIAVWRGGATLYGGFLLAVLASWLYLARRGVPLLVAGDVIAPSIALGIGLTRIGCFLSGCCFGEPTGLPWGVHFPSSCPAGSYAQGAALHPTQLYASLDGWILFVLLLWLDRRPRFDGFTFSLFLVGYGIARFVEDFFRFYELSMTTVWGLSLNQLVSLGLVATGALLWVWRSRKPTWHPTHPSPKTGGTATP
jgi:phosphatidylglycerol:prolipoprotein diacylglycerol transferase